MGPDWYRLTSIERARITGLAAKSLAVAMAQHHSLFEVLQAVDDGRVLEYVVEENADVWLTERN